MIIQVCQGICFGQSPSVLNYTMAEGLPSNEVYEVFQDTKKFIWISTDNGIVKFDGHAMTSFNVEDSLSDPVVFGFFEDPKGRVWFRTFSGKISYYDHTDNRIHKYRYNDSLAAVCSRSFLFSIVVDSLDQVWFGTHSVWGRIDSTGRMWRKDIHESYRLYYERVGRHYVFGTIARHPTRILVNGKSYSHEESTPSEFSHSVLNALEWKGCLYFSINRSVYRIRDGKMERLLLCNSGVINLSKDREDNLWIGYYKGVERYSDPDLKHPIRLRQFDDKAVTEVMQDHENGLWIGTVGKGVFYIPDASIQNFDLGGRGNIQNASLLGDTMMISHSDGLLTLVDTRSKDIILEKKFGFDITTHFVDNKRNVWLFGDSGTFRLTNALTLPKEKLKARNILDLHQAPNGHLLSVSRGKVSILNAEGKLLYRKQLPYYYRDMIVDDTLIYFMARTGVHVYNSSLNFVKDLAEFSDYKISNIHKLNDSTLLLTTIGQGFFIVNKRSWSFMHYHAKEKFSANNVYTAVNSDSMLWLGTERGVIKVSIASLFARDPVYEVLTRQGGLMDDKCNLLLKVGHELWAFFEHGCSIFPEKILPSSHPPVVYIKNFLVNNQPLPRRELYELMHDENNLTFDFGFINFHNQNIFVRYRLRSSDPWLYTTDRSLKFYALSPGMYSFQIEYSLDNTRWTRAPLKLDVVIAPALWQTWYFQTLVAFAIMLVIYLYFQNRVTLYRKHQQKLIQSEIEAIEQERSRIARDLHDSVGTDFTAIKLMVNQTLQKYSEPNSDEIENQFQNTIQEIKNIIYGLTPPGLERYGLMAGLQNYVEKLNSTIAIKIQLKTFGPEIKDPKFSIAVFRILQELIANSLKHSGADIITIHLNAFEDLLNVVYEDNGRGFAPEQVTKGLGLYHIDSRVQSLNGQLRFDSGTFGLSYFIDIPIQTFNTNDSH